MKFILFLILFLSSMAASAHAVDSTLLKLSYRNASIQELKNGLDALSHEQRVNSIKTYLLSFDEKLIVPKSYRKLIVKRYAEDLVCILYTCLCKPFEK